MYFPKVSIPKPHNVLKVPTMTSYVLEEVIDLDASSLENT
jgi:hypothetical protein